MSKRTASVHRSVGHCLSLRLAPVLRLEALRDRDHTGGRPAHSVLPTGFLTAPGVMARASASLCSFHDSIITVIYFLLHVC